MLHLDLNADNLQYLSTTGDHRDFLSTLKPTTELFSVIVFQKYPNEKAFENQAKMRKKPTYSTSSLEYGLRSLLWDDNNRIVRKDWTSAIEAHMASGFNAEPTSKAQVNKIFDLFIEMEQAKFCPDVFNKMECGWASSHYYDEHSSEEVPYMSDLSRWGQIKALLTKKKYYYSEQEFVDHYKEKYAEDYERWYNENIYPQPDYSYEVMYDKFMPPLLANLGPRTCGTTQFYYVKNGDTLSHAMGSSAGSYTREAHGYFGHAFREAEILGRKVTTYIVEIDDNLDFTTTIRPHLVLYPSDLRGNYPIDREVSEKILKGVGYHTFGSIFDLYPA